VANEVVTRAEMSHHVGRLKNLVTEDDVHINTEVRRRALRGEPRQPGVPLERVPAAQDLARRPALHGDPHAGARSTAEFYKAVAAELDAGGVAAFMHYLPNSSSGTSTSTRSRSPPRPSAT
jgi:hypothetical protein